MDEQRARAVLKASLGFDDDVALAENFWVNAIDGRALLNDDEYTADELEAIAWFLRHYLAQQNQVTAPAQSPNHPA